MKNSLNDIRLTPKMIAELYGQSLVAPVDHTAVKKAAPEPRVVPKFLGGNAKRILILVSYPAVPFIPEKELAFLTKMLEACRLNIGDVAIVNMAQHQASPEETAQSLQASGLLGFGIESNASQFAVTRFSGQPAVFAPALNEMLSETNEARALKSKLWIALKQMFGL